MGLFGIRHRNDERTRRSVFDPDGGKLYRAVLTTVLVVIFIVIAIIIFAAFSIFKMSANMVGIIVALGILCLGCLIILPWIRHIEKKEYIKTAYAFLGLIALCTLLWIIADFLIVGLYKSVAAADGEITTKVLNKALGVVNYLKVALIITLQFSIASFVANYITRYQSKMLGFQIVSYLSYLILDLWVVLLLLAVRVPHEVVEPDASFFDVFEFNHSLWSFLRSKIMLALLVLSLLYIIIANSVVKNMERKRILNATDKATETFIKSSEQKQESNNDPQARLESLKSMLDRGLITQEEYNQKRAEIISKM